MPGRVFVTGGSGFVGSTIIQYLLENGFLVNALVNRKPISIGGDRVKSFSGGLFNATVLDEALTGCDAVIHVVGIIMEKPSVGITFEHIHFEGTKNVVDRAKTAGIKRFVHMSALGTRESAISPYHQTKYRAEEYLRASGLEWTIIRPSLIHGPTGEFMQMEAKWARHQSPPYLFMPYFGSGLLGRGGAGQLQPVFVNDVARAFVEAISNRKTVGEVYPLGGADRITWPQLHQACSKAIVGKHRAVAAIPVWYAKMLTRITPASLLPFNESQVIMSQEDNTCDSTKFKEDFGWEPQPFEASLKSYAGSM